MIGHPIIGVIIGQLLDTKLFICGHPNAHQWMNGWTVWSTRATGRVGQWERMRFLTPTTAWMTLENMMLNAIRWTQKEKHGVLPSMWYLDRHTYRTENRRELLGLGEGGRKELLLTGSAFQFGWWKNSGNRWWWWLQNTVTGLKSLNWILMVKMVYFMLCTFYQYTEIQFLTSR